MAVLLSRATGNLTTASTWALVDSTSYSNSEGGNSLVPTSTGAGARSAGATTGNITIDAIAVKLANRTGTTGTITVELWNNTDSTIVTGTTVTINTSDLPAAVTASVDGGWIVFKFASSVTLANAKSYMVQVTTSSASQVVIFTNGTATNWSRALRTTTTQAPVAGDDMIVAGEHTGAGTGNDLTVTNNQTAATDYGSNTNSTVTPAVSVCKRGTLKWADGSAGNPYLRLSGHLIVYSGGTLNIGTTGTPIPRDSTAILEFDQLSADGDCGLIGRNGATVNIQGLSRTSGKNVWKTLLTADASASGGAPSTSTLTIADDTGWLSGDMVAIASTSRTAADCEAGNLNANAGASSIVVKDATAAAAAQALPLSSNRGLLVAHSGTSPTQAEIILITRNVKIRSTSATLMAYVFFDTTATVDIDWAEFYYLGENTNNKRGIEVNTTTGSFSMQFSSIHDCEDFGFYPNGAGNASFGNVTFSNNAMWNCATVTGPAINVAAATTGVPVFDSNIVMRTLSGNCVTLSDIGLTFTNNTMVGAAAVGVAFLEGSASLGTFIGNVSHSNVTTGFSVTTGMSGTISGGASWRNTGTGVTLTSTPEDLIVDGMALFGNTTQNISLGPGDTTLKNLTVSGDTTFSTISGISFTATNAGRLVIDNCDFGTASGIKTAHSQDINVSIATATQTIMRNTKLASATEVATPSNLRGGGFISSQKHDQTAGNHVFWLVGGKGQTDATFYNTASPSIRLTPTSASIKMESAPKDRGMQIAVASGATATVSAYIRKSAAGDGAAYNGNQPRLIQRANPALGQNSDVVLATYSGGTGSWAQISGTTSSPTDDGCWEIVVDADGTAGWINVDDFAVT